MNIVNIGGDFFNLEYLVKVKVDLAKNDASTATLVFMENQSVTVTLENWEQIKSSLIGRMTEYPNDYKPAIDG